jgi:predicted small lipoprotein YifL
MKRVLLSLTATAFVLLTTACGQTGPLYVPGNPSKIQNPPPPAEQSGQEQEEDAATDKE